MGDRTVVRFVSGSPGEPAEACVYLHWGGAPNQMAVLFGEFFERVETEARADTRYNDPSYLAAKFVVFCVLYGFEEEHERLTMDFSGVGIIPDRPIQEASHGVWLYSILGNGSGTRRTLKRPDVFFHDVILHNGDEGQQEVVWQRFVPLGEAANNYEEDKQNG